VCRNPVTLIVSALVTGATSAIKDTASNAAAGYLIKGLILGNLLVRSERAKGRRKMKDPDVPIPEEVTR